MQRSPFLLRLTMLTMAFVMAKSAECTSHVFVLTDDGVWLASDSLWRHYDGQVATSSHECKVVISRRRLIFNTGAFDDLHAVMETEQGMPFGKIEKTRAFLGKLLADHRQADSASAGPGIAVVNGGVIQLQDGKFFAEMYGVEGSGMTGYHRWIKTFIPGVAHGYGPSVDLANARANSDESYKREILQNPEAALLNILESEMIARPSEVGPPYTILLLRKDGYVVDYSDKPLCKIPAEAKVPTQLVNPKR